MAVRDHQPIVIEEFNGLWRRGDPDSCPPDHFPDCENIQFIESGFRTRDGIDTYRAVANPLMMYNYVMQTGDSLIILDANGDFYHSINQTVTYGPILHVTNCTDFGFVAINGRAYITPFTSYQNPLGIWDQKGMPGEFVYVYKGDGQPARKAAGFPPVNGGNKSFISFNSQIDGLIDKGVHVIAVAYNGGILGPEVFPVVLAPGGKQIELTNIPIGPAGTTSRTIVMTHAIDPKNYVADQTSYTYYTALTIADNTTVNAKLSIADSSLTAVYSPGVFVAPVTNALLAANTAIDGFSDFGLHIFAVVYETDTGYLTKPGPEFFAALTTVDIKKAITLTNIPISPDPFVVRRHIVATAAIENYNGDQIGFQLFFVPDGTLNDNTTTTLTVNFYDSDLIDDASHLLDNFSEIPAGVRLTTYHGRLVLTTTYNDISVAYLSEPGEPEAIDQVDGIIIAPLDGNPLSNAQEFRDILYLFKKTTTLAYSDNNDVPSSWPLVVIDQGIGASVHGVATVLDSGGVNIDYLMIIDYSGIMIFNGAYVRPELSWKIDDFWKDLDRYEFRFIQIMNDSLNQRLYITLPSRRMLLGDYANGLNPKDIRFTPWRFDVETTTITLLNIDQLIIGARVPLV